MKMEQWRIYSSITLWAAFLYHIQKNWGEKICNSKPIYANDKEICLNQFFGIYELLDFQVTAVFNVHETVVSC